MSTNRKKMWRTDSECVSILSVAFFFSIEIVGEKKLEKLVDAHTCFALQRFSLTVLANAALG